MRRGLVAVAVAAGLLTAGAALAAAGPDPFDLASRVAALGPRVPGTPGHRAAQRMLLAAMHRAGLQDVTRLAVSGHPEMANLTGVVPGQVDGEIVLAAHYDTVDGSPGAVDDAGGCAVAIAAAARLVGEPALHSVRVVLFDGEEAGLAGSRAWAEALGGRDAAPVVALLDLDMVGRRSVSRATLHLLPAVQEGRRTVAPAWLVSALLDTARRADFPLEVGDSVVPVLGQLAERTGRLGFVGDSEPTLAAGVPSVLLSDISFADLEPTWHGPGDVAGRLDAWRLRAWAGFVTAATEDLGETRSDAARDDYLVVAGWTASGAALRAIGLAVGVLVLLRSLLAWRRRRLWLPGLFAIVAVGAFVVAPLGAAPLLGPALLVELVRPARTPWRAKPLLLAGFLPVTVFAALLALAAWRGLLFGIRPSPVAAALLTGALAVHALSIRQAMLAGPP